MFSNFKKAFSQNILLEKIPDSVLETLSKELPSDLEYVSINNEACVIHNERMEIKGHLKIDIPDNINIKNKKDFHEYLYRTQKTAELISDENGCIYINGSKVKIIDMVKFPLSEGIVEGTEKLVITPKPFPEPVEIELCNGIKIWKLFIKRVPYESMETILIKSTNSVIYLKYFINEKEKYLNLSIKINIEKAKSIAELVFAMNFFNEMIQRKELLLNGVKFCFKNNNIKMINNETLNFWNKIEKIEKIFNIKIKPKIPKDENDLIIIEQLYKTVIEKQPFKIYGNISELKMDFDNCNIKLLKEHIKKDSNLTNEIKEVKKIKLFSNELEVHSFVILRDFIIDDIKEDNTEKVYTLKLKPIKEGTYLSIMYFISEKELTNFTRDKNKILTLFSNAKTINIQDIYS